MWLSWEERKGDRRGEGEVVPRRESEKVDEEAGRENWERIQILVQVEGSRRFRWRCH